MSRSQNIAERDLHRVATMAPPELMRKALPAEQRIGMMVLLHTPASQLKPFASGAEGHTAAQLHLEGELYGGSAGRISVRMPELPGNILLIPRRCLIETRNGLIRYEGDRIPFDGPHIVQGIMQHLYGREIDGVRYDACVSFARDDVNNVEDITYALPGPNREQVRVRIPLPE